MMHFLKSYRAWLLVWLVVFTGMALVWWVGSPDAGKDVSAEALASAQSHKRLVLPVQAYFVIPDGASELVPGSDGLLALTIKNDTPRALVLDAFHLKGKEQLNEEPMPKRQTGVIPAYLSKVQVDFYDAAAGASGAVVHTSMAVFPTYGVIEPLESMTSLLTVKMPPVAGVYTVKLSGLKAVREGGFALPVKRTEGKGEALLEDADFVFAELPGVRVGMGMGE